MFSGYKSNSKNNYSNSFNEPLITHTRLTSVLQGPYSIVVKEPPRGPYSNKMAATQMIVSGTSHLWGSCFEVAISCVNAQR